jgi:hypothetical protein
MTITPDRAARHFGRSVARVLALVVALAGCTYGAATVTPGPTDRPPAASVTPSGVTGEPSASPPDGPGSGGSDAFVVPKPGQLDVHPIAADSFAARVDGRHVVLTIAYTSGVEPCSVLDTIVVERGDRSFAITLRQGHGPGNQVCIMIARVMHTQVDLGNLDSGTYTITDTMRGAEPIQVVVG